MMDLTSGKRIIKDNNQVQRQSNFELLRIIAMLFILAFHYAGDGGLSFPSDSISLNRCWILCIQFGGKVGVDLFVLISGYFLINAKSIKTSKAIKLWLQLLFYSLVFYSIAIAFGVETFGYKKTLKQFAPVSYSYWWFASTYFVLYLLSPYLNVLLFALNKRQYIQYLALMMIFWSVIPTFTGLSVQSNPLLWFIFLYSLAAFIKRFGVKTKLSAGGLIAFSVFCIILTCSMSIGIAVMGTRFSTFSEYTLYFYDMQRIPVLIISTSMFLGFQKLQMKNSKLVNSIASATFGVYLIHHNKYVCPFLWKTLFRNAVYANSNYLILHSVAAVVIVFIACTIIELLRLHLLERNYMPYVESFAKHVDKKKEQLLSRWEQKS